MTSLRLMDTPAGGPTDPESERRVGTVRRRHVLYVEGYDPRGAEAYYQLFQSSCGRFRKAWSVELTLDPFEIDSDDFAHWSLTTRSAGWQVATHYDFLRLERHVRAAMDGSTVPQVVRGLGWLIDDVVSGTMWRIFRASWRFGVHLLWIQTLLVTWLVLAAGIGCNNYTYGPNITQTSTGTPTGTYTISIIGILGNNNSVSRGTTINLSVGPG